MLQLHTFLLHHVHPAPPHLRRLMLLFFHGRCILAAVRDTEQHPHPRHRHDQRRTAVADERQRHTHDGEQSRDHGEIGECLSDDKEDDAESEHLSERILCPRRYANARDQQNGEQEEDQQYAEEAMLLTENRSRSSPHVFPYAAIGGIQKFSFLISSSGCRT